MTTGAGAQPAPGAQVLSVGLEMDRRIALRGAQEVTEIPGGWVIRHHELRAIHDLNAVVLAAPLPDDFSATQLTAVADRWLGDLSHRVVRVEDEAGAERLAAQLGQAGWQRRRTLLMVHRGDPAQALSDSRARTITDAELDALLLEDFMREDFGSDFFEELPALLVATQVSLRSGTSAQGFGAGEDGGLHSTCTLFMDEDVGGVRVAMIDQVSTLPAFRERGLAKAVVSAAIRAAGDWGAELIVIPTDADDWPQLLYARLGFEGVGRQVIFQRRSDV